MNEEEVAKALKQYRREQYLRMKEEHPEKIKEYNDRSCVKNRDNRNASCNRWKRENKDRAREIQRRCYEKNKERIRLLLNNSEEFRVKRRIHNKAYREKNHEKVRVQKIAQLAVTLGKIVKPEACECGAKNVQMHHPDYSQPLLVEWLCALCHGKRHRLNETVSGK